MTKLVNAPLPLKRVCRVHSVTVIGESVELMVSCFFFLRHVGIQCCADPGHRCRTMSPRPGTRR